MITGHKIKQFIEINAFINNIRYISKENIKATAHTFFRLEERKLFKDNNLIEFIVSETPILVGLQNNGLYAVFYNFNKKILKIILEIQPLQINIVTFYIIEENQIPKWQ